MRDFSISAEMAKLDDDLVTDAKALYDSLFGEVSTKARVWCWGCCGAMPGLGPFCRVLAKAKVSTRAPQKEKATTRVATARATSAPARLPRRQRRNGRRTDRLRGRLRGIKARSASIVSRRGTLPLTVVTRRSRTEARAVHVRLAQCTHGALGCDRCRRKRPEQCMWSDTESLRSFICFMCAIGCGVQSRLQGTSEPQDATDSVKAGSLACPMVISSAVQVCVPCVAGFFVSVVCGGRHQAPTQKLLGARPGMAK